MRDATEMPFLHKKWHLLRRFHLRTHPFALAQAEWYNTC